jgi:hypothetical protein
MSERCEKYRRGRGEGWEGERTWMGEGQNRENKRGMGEGQ